MPEAAEVAIAACQMHAVSAGRVLDALEVTHPRSTRAQPADALRGLVGETITSVVRHGKWIVVRFASRTDTLGIHLRMSGQLSARPPDAVPDDRHVHAILRLSARPDGHPGVVSGGVPGPPAGAAGVDSGPVSVWFRDPRTFGELRLLGPVVPVAPDLDDPAVTADLAMTHAARRSVGVKAVLLDQTGPVAGIGSYLADEALHAAGISPRAPANRLHREAWDRILAAARDIARRSALAGGVTLADEGWIDLWGRPGRFAPELRVHGLARCATCGEETRSATVGGRRARWCPTCQDARRCR